MSALGNTVRRLTLWPSAAGLNAKIGCWGELGRAIHWVGAALASNLLVIGLFASIWDPGVDPTATIIFCVVSALILYLPGRGLRRLMAGE